MAPQVVLIGPPGAGKTSVGQALAQLLGTSFRDTDADVAEQAGMSVSDIFVNEGEPAFREREAAAVASALGEASGVVSLGGGAPVAQATQDLLRTVASHGTTVVFLDVSLAEAVPRVGLDRTRPLLLGNPRQQWTALMNARRPIYEALATTRELTDGRSPEQIASSIAGGLL